MADEPESLILRYLRRLDERTERIEQNVADITADIRSLKGHMSAFLDSEVRQDGAIAAIQIRLDRIERRLDLTSEPAG